MVFRLVHVVFYDHYSEDDVEDLDSLKPAICEAVGWLVKEDELYYYLSSWTSDVHGKKAHDVNAILKATVIKIKEIPLDEGPKGA